MSSRIASRILLVSLSLMPLCAFAQKDVSVWLTNPDRSALFQLQSEPLPLSNSPAESSVIQVDDKQTYQTMDGFGFALTGGSAQLMMRMAAASRSKLLHELFDVDGDGIGVSYLRVSVGSSDMNDHVYSYDDLPSGQTDPRMEKFSLDPDRADVIPILKEILAINPHIRILASPWSAPLWMKTTGSAQGGVLEPEYLDAYAKYFVKYIQGMQAEGIAIDALTIQNEPLNEKNTPSMVMLSPEEGDFIGNHLGPAFAQAGIKTKIVLYDHNLDHPAYALAILRDPKAGKYVDGSGFHLYGGKVSAMTEVHDAFPGKNLYFTEQMVVNHPGSDQMTVGEPVSRIVVGATRNWSKNVLLWNLAADPQFGPHTDNGGCPVCQGAITIDGNQVSRNLAYYTIAHASKLVRPGSVRIGSTELVQLPNVAFRTPDGKIVLIVANPGAAMEKFTVRYRNQAFNTSLGAGSVGTYRW
jgi:glucosylceramidase